MVQLRLALLVSLLLCGPTQAAFSPPVDIGTGPQRQAAAALGGDRAGVAWSDGRELKLAVRRAGPWAERAIARWDSVLELRMTANARGTIVLAWSGYDERSARIGVAVARPGRITLARSFPVATGVSPLARLTTTAAGDVMLAWRDGRRVVRMARVTSGARLAAPRAIASRAAAFAFGPTTIAWTDAAQVLRARPWRGGPTTLVGRRARGDIQLAEGDRPIVTWLRRAEGRAARAYTRSLQPVLRPARRFGPDDAVPYTPPHVAVDARGRALAALKLAFDSPFGIGPWVGGSLGGGVWAGQRELVTRGPMVGQPQPALLPGGGSLVVFAQAHSDGDYVVAASEDGGTPVVLGRGLQTSDGRGVAFATDGGRAIVAWPLADGVRVVRGAFSAP